MIYAAIRDVIVMKIITVLKMKILFTNISWRLCLENSVSTQLGLGQQTYLQNKTNKNSNNYGDADQSSYSKMHLVIYCAKIVATPTTKLSRHSSVTIKSNLFFL